MKGNILNQQKIKQREDNLKFAFESRDTVFKIICIALCLELSSRGYKRKISILSKEGDLHNCAIIIAI